MKKGLTELVFILDRSGSMGGLESDTIGGYNSTLDKQRSIEGDVTVTTVLFDNEYELLHDRADIRGVAPLTESDYFVRGSTALIDAIGLTISKIENAQKHTLEAMRPERTLFVITTDGMENASRRYTAKQVRRMIEERRECGWEFLFLGANIDAVETARQYGIPEDRACRYKSDRAGTKLNYECVTAAITNFRASQPISRSWKASIEEDVAKRRV